MLLIVLVTCVCVLLIFVNDRRKRGKNFPPGPLSLPVIGGLYRLGRDPFTASIKLWHQYGPVVGIDFASYRSIIINDYKLLKIAFNNPSLQGRPDMPLFKTKYRVRNGRLAGILASEGAAFQENHRFALQKLKEFGFGTKRMENAILEQVDDILDFFDSKQDQEENIKSVNLFNPYAANIIWSLISARLIPDESQRLKAIKLFESIKEVTGASAVSVLFPWFIKVIPGLIGWTHFMNLIGQFVDIFDQCVESHKRNKCNSESEKDFVDLYLDEIDRKSNDPSSIFYGDLGEWNTSAVLADMISGGVDTASETMAWSLAIAINFPKVQKILQSEIDRVVGSSSDRVTLDHRPKLVYLEAFIKETMRFRPIVPWALPHKATDDTKIGGYDVPKGSTIYANLFAICQDPQLWSDPHEFRPERFLSDDGRQLLSIEAFTPFSQGRRICPGRSLGMEEMFLVLGNIFKRYDISMGQGQSKPPSLKHTTFLIMTPHSFMFSVKKRR